MTCHLLPICRSHHYGYIILNQTTQFLGHLMASEAVSCSNVHQKTTQFLDNCTIRLPSPSIITIKLPAIWEIVPRARRIEERERRKRARDVIYQNSLCVLPLAETPCPFLELIGALGLSQSQPCIYPLNHL